VNQVQTRRRTAEFEEKLKCCIFSSGSDRRRGRGWPEASEISGPFCWSAWLAANYVKIYHLQRQQRAHPTPRCTGRRGRHSTVASAQVGATVCTVYVMIAQQLAVHSGCFESSEVGFVVLRWTEIQPSRSGTVIDIKAKPTSHYRIRFPLLRAPYVHRILYTVLNGLQTGSYRTSPR